MSADSFAPALTSGEALELAIAKRMHVDMYRADVSVYWWGKRLTLHCVDEPLGDDPAAAVRRAIWRAAQEMAKVEQ